VLHGSYQTSLFDSSAPKKSLVSKDTTARAAADATVVAGSQEQRLLLARHRRLGDCTFACATAAQRLEVIAQYSCWQELL
jgi:hypothetical protein